MNPLTFSLLKRLTHEDFLSGERLAAEFGISRATVSNALAEAEALGVRLFRLPGRGYRLAEPLSWLAAAKLESELAARGCSLSCRIEDVVDSTNASLLRLAQAGAGPAMALAAEWQTAGRGRRGRRWLASLGGSLIFSVLWRFPQGVAKLSGLSLAVGLALVQALGEAGFPSVALKWPNDLVVGQAKLGGILIELSGDALGPTHAVVGVGLNLRLPAGLRAHIDQAVVDLTALGEVPDRTRLLAVLLAHVERALYAFEAEGFAPLKEAFDARHVYHGRPVCLWLPDGRAVEGRVEGVDEDGALRVAHGRGRSRFHVGELSLRPTTEG